MMMLRLLKGHPKNGNLERERGNHLKFRDDIIPEEVEEDGPEEEGGIDRDEVHVSDDICIGFLGTYLFSAGWYPRGHFRGE